MKKSGIVRSIIRQKDQRSPERIVVNRVPLDPIDTRRREWEYYDTREVYKEKGEDPASPLMHAIAKK
jgi:hypothetical protein